VKRSKSGPVLARRPRLVLWLLRRAAVIAFAAACGLATPAWAGGGTTVEDVIAGDGTAVGGTNISDLKEQIKRDRLSCAGGEAGVGVLAALGALGLMGARVRRRVG